MCVCKVIIIMLASKRCSNWNGTCIRQWLFPTHEDRRYFRHTSPDRPSLRQRKWRSFFTHSSDKYICIHTASCKLQWKSINLSLKKWNVLGSAAFTCWKCVRGKLPVEKKEEKYLDNNSDDCGGADFCKCTLPGRLQHTSAGLETRLHPALCCSLLIQFFPSTLLHENPPSSFLAGLNFIFLLAAYSGPFTLNFRAISVIFLYRIIVSFAPMIKL